MSRQALRHYAKAIDDFNVAMASDPEWAEARRRRADCHLALGESEAAIQDYDAAIANQPRDPDLYRHRGFGKIKSDDFTGAVIDLKTAISIEDGTNPQSHHYLSIAQIGAGNYEAALAAVNDAIALAPNDPRHYYCRAAIKDQRNREQGSKADGESDIDYLLSAVIRPGATALFPSPRQITTP